MGVESPISYKVLLRHVISILAIIFLEGWVAAVSPKNESCEAGECGKVIISYPYRNDSKPCFPDKLPLAKLKPFWDDHVDNRSLRLISEFGGTGNACFAPSEQAPKPPSFPSHLAFLSNCCSFPNGDYPYPNMTCPPVGANHSYVALITGRPGDQNLTRLACESNVTVRVVFSEKTEKDEEKWKGGFRLEWDLTLWEKCVKCQKSGGKCWRGPNDGLLCRRGSGIGALAIIFLCSCIYRICHKKQPCFLISRSRHASSDSSLKADLEVGNAYFGVPIFTNAELEEATNHFDSARELGDGGFGIVYYGKLRDGREVAVKRQYEHNYRRVRQFMTEVEILTRLRHKNLVSLLGCTSRHSRELLLVYEYIPNGTVADHLHGEQTKQDPLLWHTRISIAIETATALAYLHACDIIHRDVKTNNILLDKNFGVKVADFGLSRLFPNDASHVSTAPQGTPGYVDPEYHQCYQLTEKSDVYSFGVVLVELISSMPAVDISGDKHEINLANLATNKIRNREFRELIDPNLGFELDPEINRMIMAVAELAFGCLQQDKDMRPSMETVLEELKAISSGTHEPDKSKDVSDDNSAGQSKKPTPPECDNVGLLKIMKLPTSPVSVTQN
ncbi:hypothetical protein BT93_D1198 [Corymbia citriodora subsp. variegata]|nr:hypothetical protein BT93_D1198 [Corymbia citriodora subsp. variegata]